MGDRVGRKWGLVASCLIFALGVGLQLDDRWATFIVGRVIAGIGVVCSVRHDVVYLLTLAGPGPRILPRAHVSIRGNVISW